jgi:glycosyltransferase involved in cell wall biosynthesis
MVNTNKLKLSLIVTTHNRLKELNRFIDSIKLQDIHKFEVILVNQGEINIELREFFLKYNWTIIDLGKQVSLSYARNIGLKYFKGEFIGFPDDDCWYPDNFIKEIIFALDNLNGSEAICVSVFDPILQLPYGDRPRNIIKSLNFSNVIKLPVSVGIFIKSKIISNFKMQFNENLGAGTYYGGGEETAFMCKVLLHKKKVIYNGFLTVYHEIDNYNSISIEKIKKYSRGYGYIIGGILKLKKLTVLPSIFIFLIKSIGGLIFLCYRKKNIIIYYNRIIYFFSGMIDAFKNKGSVL